MNKKTFILIAFPLLAALAVNTAIFMLGWNDDAMGTSLLDPPGALIGSVWIGLFVCMGLALREAMKSPAARDENLPRRIVILILLCLAYPFYTMGFQSGRIGLAGNIATFVYALVLTRKAWSVSRKTAQFLIPLLLWLVYASMITTHKLTGAG